MKRYKVRRAADVTRDLDLIEDHLVRVYQDLGEDPGDAAERAAVRLGEALRYMRTFETYPHRGTEHPQIHPGLRTVTSRSFIFYFEVDEASAEVSVLAVFFGGADHRRQITDRLRH
ncbi:type II toxin-antitoxin system RelE/ParE family toxin [Paracraurococcus lichenis]|uniref:Type II toxin-antitoxin system RelE/ParE family toxin n=1 Tax=Paracraurococcus lichenis TaxID=3064888 RepID=A0ABT9ECH5_9PROT|nr:type II toxin-antitoxin system RelE/ParE family toxin [Paracraurococcus sp. LOR1-02]MDO9713735.1 type II toxin-antitoxin system RelE/ParE family toxin [Paracraurococcus sp. LOR1-02]